MGELTRREFLHSSAGAALVGAAASLSWPDPTEAASNELVANTVGGVAGEAIRDVYFIPFEKETGIRVTQVFNLDFAKLKAMILSGNIEWDVTELEGMDEVIVGARQGWFEPLDYKMIKVDDFYPEAVHPYGIADQFFSTVLAYRKEFEGRRPRNWAEFWDVKKFPGARSLGNYVWAHLEFALMADGVPPDKIYPIDVDRAFRSLDRIKPHIKVWWKAGAQPAQLLTDREVDFTSAWMLRVIAIQRKGVPVEIEWNQGVLSLVPWAIPKGAKNKENAMKFLAFMTRPDRMLARVTRTPGSGPTHRGVVKELDPSFARVVSTYPENKAKQVVQNYEWWAQNRLRVDERWNDWVTR